MAVEPREKKVRPLMNPKLPHHLERVRQFLDASLFFDPLCLALIVEYANDEFLYLEKDYLHQILQDKIETAWVNIQISIDEEENHWLVGEEYLEQAEKVLRMVKRRQQAARRTKSIQKDWIKMVSMNPIFEELRKYEKLLVFRGESLYLNSHWYFDIFVAGRGLQTLVLRGPDTLMYSLIQKDAAYLNETAVDTDSLARKEMVSCIRAMYADIWSISLQQDCRVITELLIFTLSALTTVDLLQMFNKLISAVK